MSKAKLTDSLTFPSDLKVSRSLFVVSGVALLASFVGYFINSQQFFFSYLTSLIFVASLTLASLFYVMLQHVTRSEYSVVFRRIPEVISANMLWIAILFIPVMFGLHSLYEWTHHSVVADSAALKWKSPWLQPGFFIIRNVIYFSIWTFLGVRLYRNSIKMDETGDWGLQTLLRRTSGPGLFLFGLTVPFAAFDWVMSLDPHWYSTIFGVYFFAMSFQAFFPVLILVSLYLRKRGILTNTITEKHISDMGLLTFAFTIFYAYIAFAQYLLIYYANVPEEVVWFQNHFAGSWVDLAWLILFGRFFVPFFGLIGTTPKKNMTYLKYMAIWILFMHFVELYWIIMPTLHKNGLDIHWLDFTTLIGLICLILGIFFYRFSKHSMVAKNDPLLERSLNKNKYPN